MIRALMALPSLVRTLRASGIDNADKEAETLLLHTLNITKSALWRDDPLLDGNAQSTLARLVERRGSREPLQYILGSVDFMGIRIEVGPGVLIPRPETELMCEEAIRHLSGLDQPQVLDLCTGSGCIALAIAHAVPTSTVTGVDISPEALAYARGNAEANAVGNVRMLEGNLYAPVHGMRFDLIVSNPPYIRSAEIAMTQPEIRHWEPVAALDGGPDGLDAYREILSGAACHLNGSGLVMLELGAGQAGDVGAIARATKALKDIRVLNDYAGIERIGVYGRE